MQRRINSDEEMYSMERVGIFLVYFFYLYLYVYMFKKIKSAGFIYIRFIS